MADILLQGMEAHSGLHLHGAEQQLDIVVPSPKQALTSEAVRDLHYIPPLQNATFGSWAEWDLPSSYIREIMLQVSIPVPAAGNYAPYPGIMICEQVELLSGSEKLTEFSYPELVHMNYLKLLPTKASNFLLTQAGGVALATAAVVSCVIPLPFSRFSDVSEDKPPLNTNFLQQKLRLRIKMRPKADMGESGWTVPATDIVYARIYVLEAKMSQSARLQHINEAKEYTYKGYDFQQGRSPAVATATSTVVDLSNLIGDMKSIHIVDKLVTNVTTDHKYLQAEDDITQMTLNIDGRRYLDVLDNENVTSMYSFLTGSHIGETATVTVQGQKTIRFDILSTPSDMHAGTLNSNVFNKLEVQITHTSGADAYIEYMCERHVIWVFAAGFFRRHLF